MPARDVSSTSQRGAIKDIRVGSTAKAACMCSAVKETLSNSTRSGRRATRCCRRATKRCARFPGRRFSTALGILKDIDDRTSVVKAILGFNGNAFDITPADANCAILAGCS